MQKYEAEDKDTLETRGPINLNLLDLDSIATSEFKKAVDEIEEKENDEIARIIRDRVD